MMECNIELIEFLRSHPRHRRALRAVMTRLTFFSVSPTLDALYVFVDPKHEDPLPQFKPVEGISIITTRPVAPMSLDDSSVESDTAHKEIIRKRCVGAEGPYCRLMADSLHDEVNCAKEGLTVIVKHFLSKPDGEHFGVALSRKGKNHRMLDYCPWCGVFIRKLVPGAEKA